MNSYSWEIFPIQIEEKVLLHQWKYFKPKWDSSAYSACPYELFIPEWLTDLIRVKLIFQNR